MEEVTKVTQEQVLSSLKMTAYFGTPSNCSRSTLPLAVIYGSTSVGRVGEWDCHRHPLSRVLDRCSNEIGFPSSLSERFMPEIIGLDMETNFSYFHEDRMNSLF